MSEESDALLHIADDHPCCKPTLLWTHNHLLELERENAALRDAATIIRNALEQYDSNRVNGNQYRLINTVRRAISNAARKEAQP